MAAVPSVNTMPILGTKLSPKKFTGSHDEIKRFLQHYERLLVLNRVTDDKEKCEALTPYCSRKVTTFIEALPNYAASNWAALRVDLLNYYDADLAAQRYKEIDLLKFTQAQKHFKIKSLTQ